MAEVTSWDFGNLFFFKEHDSKFNALQVMLFSIFEFDWSSGRKCSKDRKLSSADKRHLSHWIEVKDEWNSGLWTWNSEYLHIPHFQRSVPWYLSIFGKQPYLPNRSLTYFGYSSTSDFQFSWEICSHSQYRAWVFCLTCTSTIQKDFTVKGSIRSNLHESYEISPSFWILRK